MKRVVAGFLSVLLCAASAAAAPNIQISAPEDGNSLLMQVRERCGGGFHRRNGRCYRNAARPAVRWARPKHYRWRPGAAVAAGAAMGFVAASVAVWAGPPPGPNLCWYYTNKSRTKGFWDVCP